MKLYTNVKIFDGNTDVQITKNNGKYIACVPAHVIKKALKQNGNQIVVEFAGRRFGLDKEYTRKFILENSYPDAIWESSREIFSAIRNTPARGTTCQSK